MTLVGDAMRQAVSDAEVARFSALAPRWWDLSGPMRELHRMNPVRVGWIAARLPVPDLPAPNLPAPDLPAPDLAAHQLPAHHLPALGGAPSPQGNRVRRPSVLDVGCGGGIASEALARAGFGVTGLDASAEAIGVARAHAAQSGLDIGYRVGLAHDLLAEPARFDAVTALEIIEHVPDQQAFVTTLGRLLAPGGTLFVSTINRTLASLAVAKVGAEYVARLLPVGTHDWRRFVRPDELGAMGRAGDLRPADLAGMVLRAGAGWAIGRDVGINYIMALART